MTKKILVTKKDSKYYGQIFSAHIAIENDNEVAITHDNDTILFFNNKKLSQIEKNIKKIKRKVK